MTEKERGTTEKGKRVKIALVQKNGGGIIPKKSYERTSSKIIGEITTTAKNIDVREGNSEQRKIIKKYEIGI